MIQTVVVGYGLAGRVFHCPLISRQPRMRLAGVVSRHPRKRAEAAEDWYGARGYASLDEALADPQIDLVVIATPHDTHADLVVRVLEAGKHCVVDKVMALNTVDADRMIHVRDATGRMLSVFHNRRWDWDYLTLTREMRLGRIGQPRLIESSVCRYSPPRNWRGNRVSAGTILHDWGAHLIDQALNLGIGPCLRVSAWLVPAPNEWGGVDSGGHGRILMEFSETLFQIEVSRISWLERPRWWVVGTGGGLLKYGLDPQEESLRQGNLDNACEPLSHRARLRTNSGDGVTEIAIESERGSWDAFYENVVAHLLDGAPLEVTAEEAREVVRVLDACEVSSRDHVMVEGPWGTPTFLD